MSCTYHDLSDDIDSVSHDEEGAGFEEIDTTMVAAGLEGEEQVWTWAHREVLLWDGTVVNVHEH